MGTPVIVEAVRTPIGKRKGHLAGIKPLALLSLAQRGVVERSGIDEALVEQAIGGCVTQGGEQSNHIARYAWLYAGLPHTTGVATIDAQCGSAQQAVHLIASSIANGVIDVGIGCGVESMSRVSFGEAAAGKSGRPDDWLLDIPSQFEAAERIADRRDLTREDLEVLGVASQQRAKVAWDEGRFEREVAPVEAPGGRWVHGDGLVRGDTSMERLAKLSPVFAEGGTVTAGNSSPLTDGAAARFVA